MPEPEESQNFFLPRAKREMLDFVVHDFPSPVVTFFSRELQKPFLHRHLGSASLASQRLPLGAGHAQQNEAWEETPGVTQGVP